VHGDGIDGGVWLMTRDRVLLLRLKAEACRVMAGISKDAAREAHWLEQARHWEVLAEEVAREQLGTLAPTIALGDAWPVTTQSSPRSGPEHFPRRVDLGSREVMPDIGGEVQPRTLDSQTRTD
jgi:hypothetical protein